MKFVCKPGWIASETWVKTVPLTTRDPGGGGGGKP